MVYVYVISSKTDNKWYTGATTDLRKRFSEHNDNKVISTKNRGPFELIYYEACIDMNDAFTRERYLKTGMGKRYLKNRLKRFLSLTGQSILEYAVVLGVVIVALSAMSLYFRRGIQAVIKIAADEAGSQKDAEEIDPLKGVKTSALINRQSQITQRSRLLKGDSRISDVDTVTSTSGTSTSVSTQEK